jgi:hypothetical protein
MGNRLLETLKNKRKTEIFATLLLCNLFILFRVFFYHKLDVYTFIHHLE